MHAEKNTATITTKPAVAPRSGGKGEAIAEERASLVKAGTVTSYLQRRSVSAEEEEKKKKDMMKKQAASGNVILDRRKL